MLNSSCEPLASHCPTAAASMRAGCLPAKVNTIDEWGRLREGAESYAKALASDILR